METKTTYEVRVAAPASASASASVSVSNAQQTIAVMRIAQIAAGFVGECAEHLTPRGRELFWDCLAKSLATQRTKEVSK